MERSFELGGHAIGDPGSPIEDAPFIAPIVPDVKEPDRFGLENRGLDISVICIILLVQ
jgi:hypothetical protein